MKKNIIIMIIATLGLIALGFGAYKLYHVAIDDATQKIRVAIAEGIDEGVGRALNIINLPRKIFGN